MDESMDPVSASQWQEGPLPLPPPDQPNEVWQRTLAAKRALDARTWPRRGPR